MEELKKVFGSTISQVVVRFSGSLTTFLVTLLIVSTLGISALGSFVTVTTFVSIFYLLIDFGLNTVYIRDHFKKTENYFGNLVSLRLLLSFCVFILVSIMAMFIPSLNKPAVLIYSLTLFTEGVLVSFSGLTQKKLLQKTLVIPSIISSLVVLGVVYFGVTSANLLLILAAYPIGELTQIIFLFLFVRRKILFNIMPTSFYSFSKTAMLSAIPLALMLFLNVVYFRVDTIILSIYKSAAEVGAYGFSYKIFEFLLVFPTFFSASVFPLLVTHKENKLEFNKRVRHYSFILLGSAVLISILVFMFAPLIVSIRSDLSLAVLPLQILSFSLPFFFLTSLFQWILLLRGKVKLLIGIYIITMVLNIILNMMYIPGSGAVAASMVTVITEAVVFVLMIIILATFSVKKSSKPNDK